MTAASGVPPWARPVLEALQLAHSLRTSDAVNGRCATSGEIEMADARVRDACAAALASDAGTVEGEPEYRCLRCQGPIPEDALRMGEFNHCSERCAAPLAESGAAAPPTNAPETSTSLVGTAPDAELDRLLIEYARCQVQARYASRSQPEINRRAYAVEYAAAAIHAHVARRVDEAEIRGRSAALAAPAPPNASEEMRGEVIGTALIKPRWEDGDEYTPHICMGDWRRNGGTEPFYVDLVRRREKEGV